MPYSINPFTGELDYSSGTGSGSGSSSGQKGSLLTPNANEWASTQELSSIFQQQIWKKQVSSFFSNTWTTVTLPPENLYDFGVIGNNSHFLATKSCVLDFGYRFFGAEGIGITVGIAIEINTGSYWHELTKSVETTSAGGNYGKHIGISNLCLNPNDSIRFRSFLSDGGSNNYPGNREILLAIAERKVPPLFLALVLEAITNKR